MATAKAHDRRTDAAPAAVPRVSHAALSALVFGAGTGSLAVEICASRLLAPYYGSSTIVWANLIGLVLASLALGYWLGGRLADRRPHARDLARLALVGAVAIALVPFAARPLLRVAVDAFDAISVGAFAASLFAVLALIAVWQLPEHRLRENRSVDDPLESGGAIEAVA